MRALTMQTYYLGAAPAWLCIMYVRGAEINGERNGRIHFHIFAVAVINRQIWLRCQKAIAVPIPTTTRTLMAMLTSNFFWASLLSMMEFYSNIKI